MKRTKISKESLLSIGFEYKQTYLLKIDQYNFVSYLDGKISIIDNKSYPHTDPRQGYDVIQLERTFEYIDEITTLLQGLTGKTQFKK